MLLIISRNEDRPELESKILAAAFKQSVERGDIDGSRLAHKELVGLLARKSRPAQHTRHDDAVDRVFASDNLQVMDLATLVRARADLTVSSPDGNGRKGVEATTAGGSSAGSMRLNSDVLPAASDKTGDSESERQRAGDATGSTGRESGTDKESREKDLSCPENSRSLAEAEFMEASEAAASDVIRPEQARSTVPEAAAPREYEPLASEEPTGLLASQNDRGEPLPAASSPGAGKTESGSELPDAAPEAYFEVPAPRDKEEFEPLNSESLQKAADEAPPQNQSPFKKIAKQAKLGGRIRGRAARKKYTAELRSLNQASAQRKQQEPAEAAIPPSETEDEEIDQAAILRAAWTRSGVIPAEDASPASPSARDEGEHVASAVEPPPVVSPETPENDALKTPALEPLQEELAEPEFAEPEQSAAEDLIPEDEVIASFEQTVAAGATPSSYLDFGTETNEAQTDFSSPEETSFAPPEIYSNIDFGDSGEHEAAALADEAALNELTHSRPVPDPDGPSYYSWIGAEITDPFFLLHVCYLNAVRSLLVRQFSADKTTALNPHDFKRQLRHMGVAYNILFDPRTRLDYDLRQMGLRQPESGSGLSVPEDAKLPEGGGKVKLAFSELLIICRFFNPEQMLAIVNAARLLNEQQFWAYLADSGLLSAVEFQSIQTAYQLICNGLISVTQFEQAFQYVRMNQQQLLEILLAAGWLSFEELQQFADSPGHDALPEAPRFFEAHLQTTPPAQKEIQVGAVLPDWMRWDDSPADFVSSPEQEDIDAQSAGGADSQAQQEALSVVAPLELSPALPAQQDAGSSEFNAGHCAQAESGINASAKVSESQLEDETELQQIDQHETESPEFDASVRLIDFSKLAQMAEDLLLHPLVDNELTDEVPSALSDALSAAQASADLHDLTMDEVPASLSAALSAAKDYLASADSASGVHEKSNETELKPSTEED